MTRPDDIPEWAWSEAAALRGAINWQSNASNEAIARALVAAERRGIERAAKVAETGYWSSALGGATGAAVAIAIRQLGDAP